MENITGNPVTHKNFLKTRLFLVEELKQRLRSCSVIIESPRRYGKTSLIKEFMRQENEKKKNREFNTLFLELEGEKNIHDFCFKWFKELLELYRLRRRINSIINFLGKSWNSIASRLGKIKIPGFEIELREKTRDFSFSQWKEKIDSLVTGLNSFEKRTVIIFDEFPDMLMNFKNQREEPLGFKKAADSLTAWLRSLRQHQDQKCKYQFVFCGSINLRKTLEEIGVSKRINDLEPLVIPTMKKDEAQLLIESLAQQYNIEIDSEGIRFMVSKIEGGCAYYGQIMFKALEEVREREFNYEKVKALYATMLRGGNHDLNHNHSRLKDYLSPLSRECANTVLKRLCREVCLEKELFDLLLFDRISYKDYQDVVNRLIYEGYILRDTEDQGRLRFVSPVLKEWWAYKSGVM